jgi:iron(III) transport system substrate-binding protein
MTRISEKGFRETSPDRLLLANRMDIIEARNGGMNAEILPGIGATLFQQVTLVRQLITQGDYLMKKPFHLGMPVAALALLGVASAASAAPMQGEEVWTYLQGVSKAERLAILEKEAKREGEFTIYGAIGIDRFQFFTKKFNERYPDIKVNFVRLRGSQVPDKVMIEHRSGRMKVDGALSTADYIGLLSDAVAPYEPTTWDDLDPRFRVGSNKDGWTAAVFYMTPTSIGWRTDRLKKADVPTTLEGVMDPKWKGRVGCTSWLERFMDALILGYGEKAAMEKIKKLAALNPRVYRSTAALAKGIAAGEIDMAFNFNADRPKQLKTKGAPVDFHFQDPVHGSAVTISALKNGPHPYGAALFVEFMTDVKFSEELDKTEKIRLFGHKAGNFTYSLKDFPSLRPFRSIPKARFKELKQLAQDLFIRGK